ncbi:polyphenol oxidase family protein [Erwiniaceae bacterium BAC15a-03b]|uniref:Polyphenol oxidase family protein n=1 Tax=Winslowiella arboricola TaxID=2978220 RepID=A0A9J6PRF1_9GAMM|nr:polyphenol oxidase family protein [Winslowiella arboricola]MCU5771789.1 polyphenol oxidase family protein [Winslowiella arboricola]MCU5776639.1 polyphenol oxidase family protein [Winslowiella arboricola]
MQNSPPPHSRSSALLAGLGWVEHAFLPAGATPPAEATWAHQRHSADVVLAEETTPAKSRDADGVIAVDQRAVAVYTADCLPVLIADDRMHHVAAVHAGLKGALSGVLYSAVQRLIALGATADSLYIAIGPSIGSCCYELGKEVLEKMPLLGQPVRWHPQQPVNPQAVRPQAAGTTGGIWFDLPALAQQMLQQMGIPAAQIDTVPVCTYCMAEPQSSYRRNTHFAEGYAARYSWIQRQD